MHDQARSGTYRKVYTCLALGKCFSIFSYHFLPEKADFVVPFHPPFYPMQLPSKMVRQASRTFAEF